MAKLNNKKRSSPIRSLLRPGRMVIPVVIGVGLAIYLLIEDLDLVSLKAISFTPRIVLMFLAALLFGIFRDVGYMFRLRILTNKKISWRNVFDDIMLWEFSSAITPSVVGGSGVAIFILAKEGVKVGQSTAIVMITAFLDELFYVIMVPLLFLFASAHLFPAEIPYIDVLGYNLGIRQVFWLGYGFILVLIMLIFYGIFLSPKNFKSLLEFIFSFPFLSKWKSSAQTTGNEVITTSEVLKGKPFGFWFSVFGATSLSWISRFLVANALLMAFTPLSFAEHLTILSRQMVMWIIMLISPTPGSAGVASWHSVGF